MKTSINLFIIYLVSLISAFYAQAQEFRTPTPLHRWNTRALYEAGLELDQTKRECTFLEFGELRQTFVDFSLENDVISYNDTGYSHGLQLGYNWVGDWARIRASYSTGLYTDESKIEKDPITNLSHRLTTFIEVVDLRLDYEARPTEDGYFYETGVGVQYYGDTEQPFGGRAQQDFWHTNQKKAGLGGASQKTYEYGGLEQISFLARGGVGLFKESQDRRFYCRAFAGLEGNTEVERTSAHFSTEAGISICQDSDGLPEIEIVGQFKCRQYFSNIDQRATTASVDARFYLSDLGFSRDSTQRMDFIFSVGVTQPFENAADTFAGYVDDDLTGHIFIGGITRWGGPRRR